MIKVFVDSDVIISSLLSTSGAAHFLFNDPSIKFIISNYSTIELETVAQKLKINSKQLHQLTGEKCQVVTLKDSPSKIKRSYQNYVLHPEDSHVVAGTKEGKADFLISYNIKHFKVDKIKQDFNIIILSPGHFLQYLRSLN